MPAHYPRRKMSMIEASSSPINRDDDAADGKKGLKGTDYDSETLPLHGAENPARASDETHFSDYVLVDEVGRGGMGVVYRARQKSLGRTVALKMILAGELATAEEVARFKKEALAAAHLAHPGIVPIYEVGDENGQHFFTMAFIEGESLADRVAAGPLEPRWAAALFVKVAAALQYGHDHDVVHRDLKPANILLDQNDEPMVSDFGLAKMVGSGASLTGTGQVIGTPGFMPPEQAGGRSRDITPITDVYSLGATLYCGLTGRPPFQAANAIETILQVREQDPLPLRLIDPSIPRDLEAICLKCLRKMPAQRYGSMSELKSDLEAFLEGAPVSARQGSTPVVDLLLRETRYVEITSHHAVAWLGFAGTVLATFLVTHVLIWRGVEDNLPYVVVWSLGMLALGGIIVWLGRGIHALTPIEQRLVAIQKLCAAAFILTGILGRVAHLSYPQIIIVLAIEVAMLLGSIAVLVGGEFYLSALLCLVAAAVGAIVPRYSALTLGVLLAAGMLFSGIRFFWRMRAADRSRLDLETTPSASALSHPTRRAPRDSGIGGPGRQQPDPG